MPARTALRTLFSLIIVVMLAGTISAATHQSMFAWRGMTSGPDRYWTIATMLDAYCGFLTFYVWVFYKETRWLPRIAWFAGIMLLGNMAMSAYVLLQLARLGPGAATATLLAARNP